MTPRHRLILAVGTAGSDGREFEGLRVAGEVSGDESEPDRARFTVSNLYDKASVGAFRVEGAVVRIHAGYVEAPHQLFIGDVERVITRHPVAGTEVEIHATDGGRAFRGATIAKAFARSVTARQLLNELATALGVPLGTVGAVADKRFATYTLSGSVAENLDVLSQTLGMRWSIRDGALQLLAPSEKRVDVVPEFTPSTGLVGSPVETEDGIECVVRLDGRIRPGVRIVVESREIRRAAFKVTQRAHTFDTHGQTWQTSIQAERD